MTAWAEPYIGDESIRRPPPAKNARTTSVQLARAAGSSPTLKVIQLPRPTTGKRSPDDGIGRVRSVLGAASKWLDKAQPPAATMACNTLLRFADIASILAPVKAADQL